MSRGLPSKQYPLNGVFEMDQATALSKFGHEVILFAIDLRSFRRKRALGFQRLSQGNMQIFSINLPVGIMPLSIEIWIMKLCFNYLYKKMKREIGDPDVVHAHFPKNGAALSTFKRKRRIPVVVTEHSSGFGQSIVPVKLLKVAKMAYHGSSQVITVSSSLQKRLYELLNVNSLVVPNIIDTGMFHINVTENKEKLFTFVTVGNLIRRKRMDLTLQAFHQLVEEGFNARLLIIGGGPEEKNLIDYINSHNLSNHVYMTGRINRNEIASHLMKSHCFVLASEAETFGVVYIEALACGLPVIATKCKGPEDFINETNGFLIDVNDLGQLIGAMRMMVNSYSQFNSGHISQNAISKFSQEAVARKLTHVYENIITTQKSTGGKQ